MPQENGNGQLDKVNNPCRSKIEVNLTNTEKRVIKDASEEYRRNKARRKQEASDKINSNG